MPPRKPKFFPPPVNFLWACCTSPGRGFIGSTRQDHQIRHNHHFSGSARFGGERRTISKAPLPVGLLHSQPAVSDGEPRHIIPPKAAGPHPGRVEDWPNGKPFRLALNRTPMDHNLVRDQGKRKVLHLKPHQFRHGHPDPAGQEPDHERGRRRNPGAIHLVRHLNPSRSDAAPSTACTATKAVAMGLKRTDEFRRDAVRIALNGVPTRKRVADDSGSGSPR